MPDPIILVCRDQKFELEHGVPFQALKLLDSDDLGRVEEGISMTLGDDADAFWEMRPSVPEVMQFLKDMIDALGFGEFGGNPTPSSGSSTKTGRRSKPTSKGSTASA